MKALVLTLVLASLTLAVGCGGDDGSTSSTGASEATGAASGDANAEAQATARKAQTAIASNLRRRDGVEQYADGNNGSYAGAGATELSDIDPDVAAADLEVVSTDNSYTITVLSPSGTTFSIDGEQGGAPDRTCDPPSGSGCSESGDWD